MRRSPRHAAGKAGTGLAAVLGPGGSLGASLPEFEYRPAQLRMAGAVEEAIEQGGILLAEAGTGTGKTLAYLTPAILSGRKTVVATGTKTLQEQLFFKDVPLLASALPRTFTASLMKGRGNYLCRRNLRRALEEARTHRQGQTLQRIQAWAAHSERGDRAELGFLPEPDPLWDDVAAWSETCLGGDCEDYEECFLTRMRQAAGAADLVIVNHHLLLADAVLRDSSQFQVIPSCDVLVLDEAHLLEDVATDFFGVEISNLRVERLLRDAQREWIGAGRPDGTVPDQLRRLAEAAARFFRALDLPEGARRLRPADLDGPRDRGGAAGFSRSWTILQRRFVPSRRSWQSFVATRSLPSACARCSAERLDGLLPPCGPLRGEDRDGDTWRPPPSPRPMPITFGRPDRGRRRNR